MRTTTPRVGRECVVALLVTVSGQQAPKPDFETAALAWDRGDYVAALTAFKACSRRRAASSGSSPSRCRRASCYQTREVTADGANPAVQPGRPLRRVRVRRRRRPRDARR